METTLQERKTDQSTPSMNPLLQAYQSTRQLTEQYCAPLEIEDYVPQPAAFASPPKWHLAHTSWFFEEMILSKFLDGYERFHKDFSFLFNSYYNSVGKRTQRANRGLITRPTVKKVYEYRAYVDQHMETLIQQHMNSEIEELLILGINHEQQHQELLLTDLKYALSQNPIHPVYDAQSELIKDPKPDAAWIKIPAGFYQIGFEGDGFCFDNELGRHQVYLNDFEVSTALVSNGEYMKFIEAGGYKDFSYWLDEGWAWVNSEQVEAPLYWEQVDGKWRYFTLAGLKPVDPNAILSHISFYEAQAFAQWKQCRLLTEFEWEVASDKLNWGKRWEWTYSAYLPYPKFEIAPGAVGEYNGKFMVNQMVLRGASVATSPNHSRKTYRNFFHAGFQWQFTGIRLCR